MKVRLYHTYSKVDKKHEFCIECDEIYQNVWTQWLWFYLGKKLKYPKASYKLFPFVTFSDESKLIKVSTHWAARGAAETISNAITKYWAKVNRKTTKKKGERDGRRKK